MAWCGELPGFASSLQPQKRPGREQVEVDVDVDVKCEVVGLGPGVRSCEVGFLSCDVVVGSLHPNQPGVSQVVLVVITVELVVISIVLVIGSLQPNQPGV